MHGGAGSASRSRRRTPRVGAALPFLLPMLILYGVFFGFGFGFLIRTSFSKVSISFLDPVFVGWQNYVLLLQDGQFLGAILHTLAFGVLSIFTALTIGFLLAMALATGVKGRQFGFALFLVPSLMPVAMIGTIFGSSFQYQSGAVNQVLRAIGLGGLAQYWLSDPGLAFGVVALVFCYLIGLPILYYTADLSALPVEQIESAILDGAGAFRILGLIVYPMMRATHMTVILSLLLGSFRALEQVFFSTEGGPAGATEIVGTYLYRFATTAGATTGFVSAASVIVLIIAGVISVAQLLLGSREGSD